METLILNRASNSDVIRWMDFAAKLSAQNPQMIQIAIGCANSVDPLKCVYDAAFYGAAYRKTPLDHQKIRLSTNVLRERFANCVDYAVFVSALLRLIKIPHYFRRVGFDYPKEYVHVYIVTDSGIVIDPVLNQRQDDTDSLNNRPPSCFNCEIPYIYKKDTKVKV